MKKVFYLIMATVISIALIGCSSGSSAPQKAETTQADAEAKAKKEAEEQAAKEKAEAEAKAAEEAKAKAEAEAKAAEEAKALETLKSEAQAISYKDLARNPDTHMDKSVKYTGEVIQVQEDSGLVGLRVNITKDDYGFWDDTVYVIYSQDILPSRVLEEDIITFYGTSKGLLTYETVMGSTMTIPQIDAQIVEINE